MCVNEHGNIQMVGPHNQFYEGYCLDSITPKFNSCKGYQATYRFLK